MTAAAATCGRCLVFFFLYGMMRLLTATTATATGSLDFFGSLGVTATATAYGFFLAFPDQGFNHFQHFYVPLFSLFHHMNPLKNRKVLWRSYH
jgi:hypothetical protein